MANRLLIGDRADGGYGLYASKAGEDVLTCNKHSGLYFYLSTILNVLAN